MKKILFLLLLGFLNFIPITYAYIDYRHDIKLDLTSAIIFMNKYNNEKYIIDKKINLIYNKIKNFNFDKKINYIESIKENILNYLFSNHIQKDNIIYYRLVYYYNQIDTLKDKTNSSYKIFDITKKHKGYTNYIKNNNCIYYYNFRKYYSQNNKIKYIQNNYDKLKIYCKNGTLYKKVYKNYYKYKDFKNNHYNKICHLNIFGINYKILSGNYKIIYNFKSEKIEYRKYKCFNGIIKLISIKYLN